MKKIPTLFVRDENNRQFVTDEITPGCGWVLAGEGVATRKYDGTCVMFDGENWWARREVKRDKIAPENFIELEYDEVTGKRVGWEPIDQSGFEKWFDDALLNSNGSRVGLGIPSIMQNGTYELVGPKINGNPEKLVNHTLIRHDDAEPVLREDFTTEDLKAVMSELKILGFEGIVWHHPDGRMAKLKVKDYPA